MNNLEPSVKTVWSISILIRTIFYSIVTFIIEFFVIRNNVDEWFLPIGLLSAIIFLVGFMLAIIAPIYMYKYWLFDVREDEIYTERGVITRFKTTAPFSRIQHLEVQQSIFDRIFGLAKFVIYTAGTRGADLIIPGLPLEYAESLRDRLKTITSDDAL